VAPTLRMLNFKSDMINYAYVVVFEKKFKMYINYLLRLFQLQIAHSEHSKF
jgi:hypothetical protein